MKLFDEMEDISLQEYASNSEYEEYMAIVLDPEDNVFKTVKGLFRDKKDGYERLAKRGLVVRKIYERAVYDWILKNAQSVFDAYLMLSTAVSKWRGNNVLSDYYVKILNDIESLNREGSKGDPQSRGKRNSGFGEAVDLQEVEEDPYINTVDVKVYPYDLVDNEDGTKSKYIPEEFKRDPLEFTMESDLEAEYLKKLKDNLDLNSEEGSKVYKNAIKKFKNNMDFYSHLIDTTQQGSNAIRNDQNYAGYIIDLGNGVRFSLTTKDLLASGLNYADNQSNRLQNGFSNLDNIKAEVEMIKKQLADDTLLQDERQELENKLKEYNKEISNKQRATKILMNLPEVKDKFQNIKDSMVKINSMKSDEISPEEKKQKLDNLRVKKFRLLNDSYKYLVDKINRDYNSNISYDNPSGRDLNRLYSILVKEKRQAEKEEVSVLIDYLKDKVNDSNYSLTQYGAMSSPKLNKGPREDKFINSLDSHKRALGSRATKNERNILNKIALEKKYASHFMKQNSQDTKLSDHLTKLNDIENKVLDKIERRDNLNLLGKDRRVISKNNTFSQEMLNRLDDYNKANIPYIPPKAKLDNIERYIQYKKDYKNLNQNNIDDANLEIFKNQKKNMSIEDKRNYFNTHPKEFIKQFKKTSHLQQQEYAEKLNAALEKYIEYKNELSQNTNNDLNKQRSIWMNKLSLENEIKTLLKQMNKRLVDNIFIKNNLSTSDIEKLTEAFVNDGADLLYASIPQGDAQKGTIEEEKTQSELNQALFNNKEIKEDVRTALLNIADKFKNDLKLPFEPIDIYFTGSCANYNYNENSDIDLHLVYDFEQAGINAEVLSEYIKAAKKVFNDKYNIRVKGYPVEIGAENSAEPLVSTGVYSLKDNKWIKEPTNADVEMGDVDEPVYNELTLNIEDAIDSNNSETIGNTIKQLGELRKDSLASDGEFGVGNLLFKKLRNNHYIERLRDAYHNSISQELSLESAIQEDSLYSKSSKEIIDGLMDKYKGDEELALREIKQKIQDGYNDNKEVKSAYEALNNMVESKNKSFKDLVLEGLSDSELKMSKLYDPKKPTKKYSDQADPSYLHLSKDQAVITDMMEMGALGIPPSATVYNRINGKIPLWMYPEDGKVQKFSVFGIQKAEDGKDPLLLIRYRYPYVKNEDEAKINPQAARIRMEYGQNMTMSPEDFKRIMKLPINSATYKACGLDKEDESDIVTSQMLDLARGAENVNTAAHNWYNFNKDDLNLDKQSHRTKRALYQKEKFGYPSDMIRKMAQDQLAIDNNPIEKWLLVNQRHLGLNSYLIDMLKPEFKEKLYRLHKEKNVPLDKLNQEITKYSDKDKYIDEYFNKNESLDEAKNEDRFTIKDNYRIVSSICDALSIPHDFLGFVDFIIEDKNVKKQINSRFGAFAKHLQSKYSTDASQIKDYAPEAEYSEYYTIYGFPALDSIDEIKDENIIYLRKKAKNTDDRAKVIPYDLDKFLSLLDQEKIKTVDEKLEDRDNQEMRDTLLQRNRVNSKKVGYYEPLDNSAIEEVLKYMQKHPEEYPETAEFTKYGYDLAKLFEMHGFTPYIKHFIKTFDPNCVMRVNPATGDFMVFVPFYPGGKPNMGTGSNLYKRITDLA